MTPDDIPRDPEGALSFWDALPAVMLEEMIGDWRGAEVATGHALDGLLAASRWHGKRFLGPDEVYPLVHLTRGGNKYYADPARLPLAAALRLPMPKGALGTRLFAATKPYHVTTRPRARLRMVEHRGAVTAAMLYDARPIIDVFRRLTDDTVMGLMDMKGMDRPYVFTLKKEPLLRHLA